MTRPTVICVDHEISNDASFWQMHIHFEAMVRKNNSYYNLDAGGYVIMEDGVAVEIDDRDNETLAEYAKRWIKDHPDEWKSLCDAERKRNAEIRAAMKGKHDVR